MYNSVSPSIYIWSTYMSTLCQTRSSSETREDLAHVHHTSDPHNLEETIVVRGLGESFVLLHAPGIGAGAPREDVENYDALNWRQVELLAIHLDEDILMQILALGLIHHLAQTHLEVY